MNIKKYLNIKNICKMVALALMCNNVSVFKQTPQMIGLNEANIRELMAKNEKAISQKYNRPENNRNAFLRYKIQQNENINFDEKDKKYIANNIVNNIVKQNNPMRNQNNYNNNMQNVNIPSQCFYNPSQAYNQNNYNNNMQNMYINIPLQYANYPKQQIYQNNLNRPIQNANIPLVYIKPFNRVKNSQYFNSPLNNKNFNPSQKLNENNKISPDDVINPYEFKLPDHLKEPYIFENEEEMNEINELECDFCLNIRREDKKNKIKEDLEIPTDITEDEIITKGDFSFEESLLEENHIKKESDLTKPIKNKEKQVLTKETNEKTLHNKCKSTSKCKFKEDFDMKEDTLKKMIIYSLKQNNIRNLKDKEKNSSKSPRKITVKEDKPKKIEFNKKRQDSIYNNNKLKPNNLQNNSKKKTLIDLIRQVNRFNFKAQ